MIVFTWWAEFMDKDETRSIVEVYAQVKDEKSMFDKIGREIEEQNKQGWRLVEDSEVLHFEDV